MDLAVATLILVLLTFMPALELRFSIPVGLLAMEVELPFFGYVEGFGLPAWYVVLVCVLANILVAALFYWFLHAVVERVLVPNCPWFKRVYEHRVEKAQRRIHKSVERWGLLGLTLFIAVPLPGSGVYTGGLAAYALGMSWRRYLVASALGVLIAASIVTAVTLGISHVIL